MPDDKRFIFDQGTWILLFGEFCVIASGDHRDQAFKLDHWLLSKTRQTLPAKKYGAEFSSIKF